MESTDDKGSKSWVADGLDVKFTIRKNCSFIADANISILNPGREVIKRFLTTHIQLQKSVDYRKIYLSVGWKDENDGNPVLIFSGQVMSSIPTIPPNVWLNMQCVSRFYADNNESHFNLGSIDGNKFGIKDIVMSCVESFNKHNPPNYQYSIVLDSSFKDEKPQKAFTAKGTPRQILMKIAAQCKNIVFLYKSDTSILLLDKTTYTPKKHTINYNSGIIGMPKVNWPNVYVEIMMHPEIDVYEDVNLQIPQLDGDGTGMVVSGEYRILEVLYKGQLRGGGFSQVLHLVPISEVKKDLEKEANK